MRARVLQASGVGVQSPEPGTTISKYELIGRIATGGMAELFLARARGIEGFERLFVLKRILPQYAESGEFIRMFLREARLAATLHHSNIVQVLDIGKVDGSYFFTMEYIHGVSARELWRALHDLVAIPLGPALTIVCGAAAGLHHAHERRSSDGRPLGIVHRDVSPQNILIGYDGGVKVVDFGIAKATFQRDETRPGQVKGKVAYMSPEQCRGLPVDRRSDVFSLGVVLYELTTDSFLFDRDNELAILHQITEAPIPPPSTRRPNYPPELERIVLRALAREPDQRYATAQELQLEIEAFALEHRLALSAASLANLVGNVFGKELGAWKQAQQAGQTLLAYLTSSVQGIGGGADTRSLGEGLAPGSEQGPKTEEVTDATDVETDPSNLWAERSHASRATGKGPAERRHGRRWIALASLFVLATAGVAASRVLRSPTAHGVVQRARATSNSTVPGVFAEPKPAAEPARAPLPVRGTEQARAVEPTRSGAPPHAASSKTLSHSRKRAGKTWNRDSLLPP